MLNHLSRPLRQLLQATGRQIYVSLESQRQHHPSGSPIASPTRRHTEPQAWEQRLLVKQGTRMHATSLERNDRCSIAILDTRGLVVAWHDSLPGAATFDHRVIGTHVSQFYPAADVALQRADRQLKIASLLGANTREGWYRRANGSVFWGVTVIEALQLKQGELHGYSHVTRQSRNPREGAHMTARRVSRQFFMCAGAAAAA